jgi:uncharacterized damage-inducible protein DinB
MTPAEVIAIVEDAVARNPDQGFHNIPEYLEHLPTIDRLWRESYGRGKFGFEQADPEGQELPHNCRGCRIQRLNKLKQRYPN